MTPTAAWSRHEKKGQDYGYIIIDILFHSDKKLKTLMHKFGIYIIYIYIYIYLYIYIYTWEFVKNGSMFYTDEARWLESIG